jgi:UDP-3-O-[3-hydroxymyristoyl] glucosamine N-acyltransferase
MEKTVGELATFLDGEVVGNADTIITGINGITEAREGDLTFIANPKYMQYLETTAASAVIVSRDVTSSGKTLITVDNPYLAFAKALTVMTAKEMEYFGVSAGAEVHPDAVVDPEVAIYPLVYVGRSAQIRKKAVLYPGVYIGEEARVGEESILYPSVTLMDRCVVGNRVIIHAGTVIGSDGFGFAPDGTGHMKIPQVGIVQIDDDVEIGSNCSIDRAAMGVTWIKRGVIMDNLVQVGHNVVIDEDSIVVAQVGISGSTQVGKNVILAGQAGLVGHIKIGDGAIVTAQAGISRDVESGEAVSGTPHMPHRKWLRVMNVVPRLPEMRRELKQLAQRIEALEKGKKGEGEKR